MVAPITPDQVVKRLHDSIPEVIFSAINELILENWNGRIAYITQDAIVDRVCTLIDIDKSKFDLRWLDFEAHYRKSGWNVIYNSPGYNETFSAHVKFTKK
jgi:hypothetical protein